MREGEGGYLVTEEGDSEEQIIEAIDYNHKLDEQKNKNKPLAQQYKESIETSKRNKPKIKVSALPIQNFMQNVELFYQTQPFFYDKNNIFWLWNNQEYRYVMTDDIDLMNLIEKELELNGQTVNSGLKNGYVESFKRVGRLHIPLETPKTWIQFKDKIIDIKTNQTFNANPKYFTTNPLPHHIGESEETPIMDKLFSEWVGYENKNMLYEILAYSALSDYPIHTLFAFIGSGRNGKSRYLELINRFIGKTNITSTELDDLLDNRFEKTKLYKKLVCVMGETNFGTIKKSSLIKKLTGQDLIGFELKNKNPFDDYNYAKIIISSNSLPSSDDTSDGFYRRWIILRFPNEFSEGRDILETIPQIEYNNLAKKIISILKELLDRACFTKQGSIEERKANYIMASNPLTFFIKEHCYIGENLYIKYNELYTHYSQYLLKNKQRVVSKKEFSTILNTEGYHVDRTSKSVEGNYVNGMWVLGLSMKNLSLNMNHVHNMNELPITPLHESSRIETRTYPSHNSHTNETNLSQPLFPFEELQSILLDKPTGWLIQNAVAFGFTDNQLKVWKDEGLIFESPSGTLRLV